MSLWTDVEPVAMARCETAVSEGVAVTLRRAITPSRVRRPRPRRRAGVEIMLDDIGSRAVERNQQDFRRAVIVATTAIMVVIVGGNRRRGNSEQERARERDNNTRTEIFAM